MLSVACTRKREKFCAIIAFTGAISGLDPAQVPLVIAVADLLVEPLTFTAANDLVHPAKFLPQVFGQFMAVPKLVQGRIPATGQGDLLFFQYGPFRDHLCRLAVPGDAMVYAGKYGGHDQVRIGVRARYPVFDAHILVVANRYAQGDRTVVISPVRG